MRDIPRLTFLAIMDVLVAALLVMVLSGCNATPRRFHHGDYVMNVASAAGTPPGRREILQSGATRPVGAHATR